MMFALISYNENNGSISLFYAKNPSCNHSGKKVRTNVKCRQNDTFYNSIYGLIHARGQLWDITARFFT